MGRRLTGTVPVHQDDGTVKWYGPDDEIPAAVAKTIGDHAWEDDDADDESTSQVPPRGGAGSGADAWLAYARTFGDVDVPDDASREDIIAALEQAGHPTAAE